MAIDKLNNDGVLDLTAPPTSDNSEMEVKSAPKMKVNMSGGSANKREKVSIQDIKKTEEPEKHGDPYKGKINEGEILDLTNPNSMFSKYMDDKTQEYHQRMEIEEERVREAVDNGELDPEGEIAKSWLGDPNDKPQNTVRSKDLDLDEAFGELEENNSEEDINLEDTLDKGTFNEPTESVESTSEIIANGTDEEDTMKDLVADSETEEEIEEKDDVDLDDVIGDTDSNSLYSEEEEEYEAEQEAINGLAEAANDYEESKSVKEESTPVKKEKEKKDTSVRLNMDLDIRSKKTDFKDDDEEAEENSANDDELMNKLRRMATEKLKPTKARIDISNFQVSTGTVKNINPILNSKESKVAKWVLFNQEQIVLMREFTGVELQTFVETAGNTGVSNVSRRYRLIYNHIESPKPETFEKWLKSTPFSDADHYYFGVYVASFEGSNYMPIDCAGQNCPEGTFVSDNIPVMNLVKFKDNETRNKFKRIYQDEEINNNIEGKYVYNIVPINDSIAIAFKEPMLYDYIESMNVDNTFQRKYNNTLQLMPFIHEIYAIDVNSGQLIPVGYQQYDGNAAKTFRSKVRKYNTLFSYLSPDEYSLIEAYSSDISNKSDGITYITPSLKCPYCGTESAEQEMTAESLVFTRYQLGALVNTTLK